MNEVLAEKFVYRITMKKVGAAKFISHLDLLDILKSAISCAGFPVYYSKGFNPTMKISYPYPLPVGVSGQNEVFDVYLTEKIPAVRIARNLNRYLMDGIHIIEVGRIEKRRPIKGGQNVKTSLIMTLLRLNDDEKMPDYTLCPISEIINGDNVDDIDVKYIMSGMVRISFKLCIDSKLKPQKFLSGLAVLDDRTYRVAAVTRVSLS